MRQIHCRIRIFYCLVRDRTQNIATLYTRSASIYNNTLTVVLSPISFLYFVRLCTLREYQMARHRRPSRASIKPLYTVYRSFFVCVLDGRVSGRGGQMGPFSLFYFPNHLTIFFNGLPPFFFLFPYAHKRVFALVVGRPLKRCCCTISLRRCTTIYKSWFLYECIARYTRFRTQVYKRII